MKSKRHRPQRRQPRSDEVRDTILGFIERKFYPGRGLQFTKDTPRLLNWVVFKLAEYLDDKAVSIPTDRYVEIMLVEPGILMEALKFGDVGNIAYIPAWLGKIVESHLDHHGEDYYEEGKAIRNHVDAALKIAHVGVQGRDPVRELAQASRLLKAAKKKPVKLPNNDQLTML